MYWYSYANLREAVGNAQQIFSMQLSAWRITFTKDTLCIGCQQHPIEKWRNFTSEEIALMSPDALPLWKTWKDFIFLAIEKSLIKD
jgi:hypothetical protein